MCQCLRSWELCYSNYTCCGCLKCICFAAASQIYHILFCYLGGVGVVVVVVVVVGVGGVGGWWWWWWWGGGVVVVGGGGVLLQLKHFLFSDQLIYLYFVSMWSKYNALLMVESWANGLHCFCYTNLRPLQRTCHLRPLLLKWFTVFKGMDTLLHSLIYMDMITHPCLNVNASLIEIPLKSWFRG